MKRVLAVVLSLGILAAALAGLFGWMIASRRAGLLVEATPAPPALGPAVRLVVLRKAPGPVTLRVDGRVRPIAGGRATIDPKDLGPGLHTVTVRQDYLGGEVREASFAWLAGPFGRPGAAVPCSVRLVLSQRALDALAARLGDLVKARLGKVRGLPRAKRVTVGLHLVSAGVDATISARFDSGATLTARMPLTVTTAGDGLISLTRRGPVKAMATGTLGILASLKGGGILAALGSLVTHPDRGLEGAIAAARAAGRAETGRMVSKAVDTWLPEIDARLATALPRTLSVGLLGARLTVGLVRCGAPATGPGPSLVVRYGARVRVAATGAVAPKAPAIPGPVIRGIPLPSRAPALARGARLDLSEDLVSAVLDATWRSGALSAWAGDPKRLDRLNRRLAATLDLTVSKVALTLPPTVRLSNKGIRVRLGETHLTLGGHGPRHLVAALEGSLRARIAGGRIEVGLTPTRVVASCGRTVDGRAHRWPCYPDLLEGLTARLERLGPVSLTFPRRAGRGAARLTVTGIRPGHGRLTVFGRLRLAPPSP